MSINTAIKRVNDMKKNPPRKIKPLSLMTRDAMREIIRADRELDRQERHEQKAS